MKYVGKVLTTAVLGLALVGCSGAPMKSQHYDSTQYTLLGPSEASTTGVMLPGMIPIGQNSRSSGRKTRPFWPKAAMP